MSICHTGSGLMRRTYVQNIVKLGFDGGLRILSIQLNLVELTHIVSLDVDSLYRKSICTEEWVENVDLT